MASVVSLFQDVFQLTERDSLNIAFLQSLPQLWNKCISQNRTVSDPNIVVGLISCVVTSAVHQIESTHPVLIEGDPRFTRLGKLLFPNYIAPPITVEGHVPKLPVVFPDILTQLLKQIEMNIDNFSLIHWIRLIEIFEPMFGFPFGNFWDHSKVRHISGSPTSLSSRDVSVDRNSFFANSQLQSILKSYFRGSVHLKHQLSIVSDSDLFCLFNGLIQIGIFEPLQEHSDGCLDSEVLFKLLCDELVARFDDLGGSVRDDALKALLQGFDFRALERLINILVVSDIGTF